LPTARHVTRRVSVVCLRYMRAHRSRATGLLLLCILLMLATTKSRHRSSRPSPYASFLHIPRIQCSRSCGAGIPQARPVPPNRVVTIVTYTLNTVRYDCSITLMLTQCRHSLVFPTAYLEHAHGTVVPCQRLQQSSNGVHNLCGKESTSLICRWFIYSVLLASRPCRKGPGV
jgi:hypothetical protein